MAISNNILELFKSNFKAIDFLQSGIDDNKNGYKNYIISITGCDEEEAIELIRTYNLYVEPPKQIFTHTHNTPKCPICQSTNLSKISSLSKAAKIAAFGMFGMGDNGKTWKCNQCGSKF